MGESNQVRSLTWIVVGTPAQKSNGHLACPFCASYEVDRLFIGSTDIDSCECAACGARWDEDRTSGEYRGRAARISVLLPPRR
jgi:transposase-like protein